MPVLAPALRDQYGLSLHEIGLVLAAEWIGLTFGLLPWGFAVDRFGERFTLALGLGGCAACLAGAAFASDFSSLTALLLGAGLLGGAVQSGSGRAVMRWFGAGERGLALGVRQTAVPVGGVVAALVLPLLGDPRSGFLFLAGFVLAGAVAGAVFLRSGFEGELDVDAVETSLRDRRLLLVCLVSSLYLVAQVALMSFGVLFLHDAHGFAAGSAAAVLAASQVLAGALRIGVGRWSDLARSRFGPFRQIGVAVAVTLALVAVAASAGGWILVPLVVVATAISMAWNGVAFTIAAVLGGRRSGAAIGFQQTALSAAGVVIPVAFAAAVAATSWRASFGMAAAFPLVGWLLLRHTAE